MNDTRPNIAQKIREMFQTKSPVERIKMGFSMYETAKYLVARSIWETTPIYSGADLRKELFLRFYGNEFDPVTRQKILDHIGPATRLNALSAEEYIWSFHHIPESEKIQDWWVKLLPIIQARLSRGKPENCKLLKILNDAIGLNTWKNIKKSLEIACKNVINADSIFSRVAEIRISQDPDRIIDDIFCEVRTVPYLFIKGFKNITHSRQNGVNFTAEFNERIFRIASTYVDGLDFKAQDYAFTANLENTSSIYKIRPDKLFCLFEKIYSSKKEQIINSHKTDHNLLIFMLSDLEETYASWLEHAQMQGVHPILKLILGWEIPTVIFGCGSIYEPSPNALGGAFGKLTAFDWENYQFLYLE